MICPPCSKVVDGERVPCDKRYPGCHDHCEAFKLFKEKKEAERKNRNKYSFLAGYSAKRKRKYLNLLRKNKMSLRW